MLKREMLPFELHNYNYKRKERNFVNLKNRLDRDIKNLQKEIVNNVKLNGFYENLGEAEERILENKYCNRINYKKDLIDWSYQRELELKIKIQRFRDWAACLHNGSYEFKQI